MFFKKKKKDSIYSSLNRRLFAGMIDLFLLIIIWTPLEKLLLWLIFTDKPSPSAALSMVMQKNLDSSSQPPNFGMVAESFHSVTNSYGLGALLLEQFSPLLVLAVLTFIFWIKKQATPGKMILSLKIVDNKTLGKPTKLQFIIRILAYPISFLPFGLGMFCVAFNKNRRALHDFIAGTAVIRVQKKKDE